VTTNHTALLTDRLDAGVDLHLLLFSLSSIRYDRRLSLSTIGPLVTFQVLLVATIYLYR
jgi:hypothetical protein